MSVTSTGGIVPVPTSMYRHVCASRSLGDGPPCVTIVDSISPTSLYTPPFNAFVLQRIEGVPSAATRYKNHYWVIKPGNFVQNLNSETLPLKRECFNSQTNSVKTMMNVILLSLS